MDYHITDPYLIKDNEKVLYSEKIIRLPKIWSSHEKLDEKLENYIQLYDWITSLGYPESLSQFSELQTDNRFFKDKQDGFQERSDGTLIILNSNFQEAGKIKFRDLFPTELTGIPFDATIEQQQYYTATAIFKYTMFDLIDDKGTKV